MTIDDSTNLVEFRVGLVSRSATERTVFESFELIISELRLFESAIIFSFNLGFDVVFVLEAEGLFNDCNEYVVDLLF